MYINIISDVLRVLRNEGAFGLAVRVEIRILKYFPLVYFTMANIFPRRAKGFKQFRDIFTSTNGIEFGGPSSSFSSLGIWPVYPYADDVDNVTFSTETHWEGKLEEGHFFSFREDRKKGFQFIRDTKDLGFFSDSSYDFVLSCHMLEHSANPLKILTGWKRILKPHGSLLLILPHKDATFDRFRSITELSHLIQDYENDIDENDDTHFEEVFKYHDIDNDGFLKANNYHEQALEFRHRVEQNFSNRMLHHHVFDTRLALQMVDYVGFQIVHIELVRPNNIIILARNSSDCGNGNQCYLEFDAAWRRSSVFKSDRV